MIIVEGPDGGGKTTLIHTLSERLNLPVAPRVVSKDAQAMVNLRKWVEKNVSEGFQPVIFDRHRLISEPIYGPTLRSYAESGFDEVQWLHEMNLKFYVLCRPIIIYCIPPIEVVLSNIKDDPDNRVVRDDIWKIYTQYANKAATELVHRPHSTFLYDYTDGTISEYIIRAIEGKMSDV